MCACGHQKLFCGGWVGFLGGKLRWFQGEIGRPPSQNQVHKVTDLFLCKVHCCCRAYNIIMFLKKCSIYSISLAHPGRSDYVVLLALHDRHFFFSEKGGLKVQVTVQRPGFAFCHAWPCGLALSSSSISATARISAGCPAWPPVKDNTHPRELCSLLVWIELLVPNFTDVRGCLAFFIVFLLSSVS